MTTSLTVAVTGATGFVGRYIVRELLARGHGVRALVRSGGSKVREAFGSPLPERLELYNGDVTDPRAMADLVRGADACVHLVGIIREVRGEGEPQTFERMHVRATQVVTEACRQAGVKRYLHMSALGVGPEGRAAYQRTKFQAEQIVRRSGLEWTIFRPSLIHGPDGEFVRMMADLVSGEVPPWFFIPYFVRSERDLRVPAGPTNFTTASVQPVAVEDVALAFANALERPASVGEIYNLAGPEVLDWQELSEFMRDTIPGAKRSMGTWHMPGEHLAIVATVAGKLGLGSLLPFDAGQALMATEDSTADIEKLRADLGVEPRPFRAGVEAYAGRI